MSNSGAKIGVVERQSYFETLIDGGEALVSRTLAKGRDRLAEGRGKKAVGLNDPSKPVFTNVGGHDSNFRLLTRGELAHHCQGQPPYMFLQGLLLSSAHRTSDRLP